MINGVQWHLLTYVGKYWAEKGCRFDNTTLSMFLQNVKERKGVATFDIFVNRHGELDIEQYKQLKMLFKNEK